MKLFDAPIFKMIVFAALCFASSAAIAQKLPSVQKEPMLAPANIKIDGTLTEWDDTFKADNKATDFKYLLANDKDNLYIVIQADYTTGIQKMLVGGITFTFSGADKKAQATLRYPVVPLEYFMGGASSTLKNPETTPKQLEELDARANHVKEIPLSGMDGISDATISLYNELGIKAAQRINEKRHYSIELCLPLKYLKSVLNGSDSFNYKMQVNGMAGSGLKSIGGQSTMAEPSDQRAPTGASVREYYETPTYLAGSYTLAK